MAQFTITVTDEEEKALLTNMLSIQDWIDNAIHNKARQCMNRIVAEVTDRQPQKISLEEKNQIVRDAIVQTAAKKNAKAEIGHGL